MGLFTPGSSQQDEGDGIVVRAEATYRPEESDLDDGKYVFSYHIEIENQGARTVQLISRHWWITDAHQVVREVEGEGVVGQQPVIAPGQVFSYSSWCMLPTSTGWMRGIYHVVAAGGERLEIPIPPFGLAVPHSIN